MRLIQPNDLVPNTTYYIQKNNTPAGYSGKKIGEFRRLRFGIYSIHGGMYDYAYFSNLRDIPNARLPSGMGYSSFYDILEHSFFLPENEMILSNATARRSILDQRSRFNTVLQNNLDPDTSNKIANDYFPVGLGTRRKRAHKSKRRRRNNKK
jgi:hypothetical protein